MRSVVVAVLIGAILISAAVVGSAYWMDKRSQQRQQALVGAVTDSKQSVASAIKKLDSTPLTTVKYPANSVRPLLSAHERSMLALEAIADQMTAPYDNSGQDW